MFATEKQVVAGQQGQDRVAVVHLGEQVVLIVADGAGGRSGGLEAAELLVESTMAEATSLAGEAECIACLRNADTLIARNAAAGETTGVLVIATESKIYGASVGDSGGLLVSKTAVNDLTQHQVRKPFLGSGMASVVGFTAEWNGGTLLIATDGLLKYTSRDRIVETLRASPTAGGCQRLLDLVRYPSGQYPDDVGIAVCWRTTPSD